MERISIDLTQSQKALARADNCLTPGLAESSAPCALAPPLGRQLGTGGVEFTAPQCGEEVALRYNRLCLTVGETFRREMFRPCRQRGAHLLPEPAHGERHPLAFDQPVVEPGGAWRHYLPLKIDV
jgi:hypothetical protein